MSFDLNLSNLSFLRTSAPNRFFTFRMCSLISSSARFSACDFLPSLSWLMSRFLSWLWSNTVFSCFKPKKTTEYFILNFSYVKSFNLARNKKNSIWLWLLEKSQTPSKRPFFDDIILAGIIPFGFDLARHNLCGGLHASRNQLMSLFGCFEDF